MKDLQEKIFNTKYPLDAAEMIMIYSSSAFDDLLELSPEEKERKTKAFIYHTERLLGAKENSLAKTIMNIILK